MNIDIALEIVYLALSLLQAHVNDSRYVTDDLEKTLSDIVQVAAQAYRDHTGQRINPSLIRAE